MTDKQKNAFEEAEPEKRYCVQCGSLLANATIGPSLFKFCKKPKCPNFAVFQIGFRQDEAEAIFPENFKQENEKE